jgi:hypothetical protein
MKVRVFIRTDYRYRVLPVVSPELCGLRRFTRKSLCEFSTLQRCIITALVYDVYVVTLLCARRSKYMFGAVN